MSPSHVIERVRSTATIARFRDLVLEYEAGLPPDLKHTNIQEQLANIGIEGRHSGFLATVDGTPAGCIALSHLDDQRAIVNRLYVRPDFRNLGVARGLIEAVEDFSRDAGYSRLVLDTDREQLRAAYNLYLSLGFVESQPYGAVDYATPTFMEKVLHSR